MKKFRYGNKMAYKRTTRKIGGVKTTTTFNNKTGSVRRSQTVKPTKSLTITRSINKNGTIKTTTTNNINGWITRKSSTTGTGIVKAKKLRTPKSGGSSRQRSYSRSGGRSSAAADAFVFKFWKWVIIIAVLAWLFG